MNESINEVFLEPAIRVGNQRVPSEEMFIFFPFLPWSMLLTWTEWENNIINIFNIIYELFKRAVVVVTLCIISLPLNMQLTENDWFKGSLHYNTYNTPIIVTYIIIVHCLYNIIWNKACFSAISHGYPHNSFQEVKLKQLLKNQF